jgi:hypothetical protein
MLGIHLATMISVGKKIQATGFDRRSVDQDFPLTIQICVLSRKMERFCGFDSSRYSSPKNALLVGAMPVRKGHGFW